MDVWIVNRRHLVVLEILQLNTLTQFSDSVHSNLNSFKRKTKNPRRLEISNRTEMENMTNYITNHLKEGLLLLNECSDYFSTTFPSV